MGKGGPTPYEPQGTHRRSCADQDQRGSWCVSDRSQGGKPHLIALSAGRLIAVLLRLGLRCVPGALLLQQPPLALLCVLGALLQQCVHLLFQACRILTDPREARLERLNSCVGCLQGALLSQGGPGGQMPT